MSSARPASSARKPSSSGGSSLPSDKGSSSSKSSSKGSKGIGENPGLRLLAQRRILDDVFQSASEKHPGWKVLIVDEHAMKVISAAVGMYDIMERRVTIVENLDKKRAPFNDMAAIYFLDPNPDSISKLIADFSGDKVLYGDSVFVFLLGRLPDPLLDQIKNCRQLLKRIKGLVEINVDFLAKEERAFEIDMRDSFASIYLRSKGYQAVEAKIAERLVTVCATLNEYPHIRYRKKSAVATRIANLFHRKMDEFVAQNTSWWYHGGPSSKGSKGPGAARNERGILMFLDRADDCLTPLMHDFTYQSMVKDLLKMDGDRITYEMDSAEHSGGSDAKDVLLDEKDKLWLELRGKHIAAVIETLSNRIRDIMNSSSGKNLTLKGGDGNMTLSQMASALKALPEYREIMSKLSQHMHISHQCMDVFQKDNLLDLSELEQTLATGTDDEGRAAKIGDVIDQVDDFFVRMKNTKDRLRLFLITTISQSGLRSQDRRRLINSAELTRKDIRTINSLELLGLSIVASAGQEAKKSVISMIAGAQQQYGSADNESEYAASRYVAPIKPILEGLAHNELSFDEYPSVLPMPDAAPLSGSARPGSKPSARKKGVDAGSSAKSGTSATSVRKKAGGASSKWAKSGGGDEVGDAATITKFTGARNIVFMLGGLSYAELKYAREVSQRAGKEIVIGSTAFITPSDFIDDLAKLGDDEGE